MKKKTRVASLKSLKIEKSCILALNAASETVVGGKDSVVIIDPSVVFTTDPTAATACYACPPRKTQPPFCIF